MCVKINDVLCSQTQFFVLPLAPPPTNTRLLLLWPAGWGSSRHTLSYLKVSATRATISSTTVIPPTSAALPADLWLCTNFTPPQLPAPYLPKAPSIIIHIRHGQTSWSPVDLTTQPFHTTPAMGPLWCQKLDSVVVKYPLMSTVRICFKVHTVTVAVLKEVKRTRWIKVKMEMTMKMTSGWHQRGGKTTSRPHKNLKVLSQKRNVILTP